AATELILEERVHAVERAARRRADDRELRAFGADDVALVTERGELLGTDQHARGATDMDARARTRIGELLDLEFRAADLAQIVRELVGGVPFRIVGGHGTEWRVVDR